MKIYKNNYGEDFPEVLSFTLTGNSKGNIACLH